MRNLLFQQIKRTNLSERAKSHLFLFISAIFWAAVGLLLWLAVGQWFLNGSWWIFCFIGYPMIFAGIFGGFLFLYQNTDRKNPL